MARNDGTKGSRPVQEEEGKEEGKGEKIREEKVETVILTFWRKLLSQHCFESNSLKILNSLLQVHFQVYYQFFI